MTAQDIVTVEVEEGMLTRLVVRSGWQAQAQPEDLSASITEAIQQALRPPAEPEEAPLPTTRRQLSTGELREYMAMHNEWRSRARQLRRRIEAGEFRPDERPELVDPRERVFVEFRMGNFERLHLHPEWAAGASLQALSDTVLDLLDGVQLLRPDPAARERAELRDLDRRIREFAS